MKTVLRAFFTFLATAFLVVGLLFIFRPTPMLDFWALTPQLAENQPLAWSTVRGDIGGIFLSLAATIGLGIWLDNRTWLQAAMILMGTVLFGRIIGVFANGGNLLVYLNMLGETLGTIGLWIYTRLLDNPRN